MVTPDRQEIVFAGAGVLWGATTFFRGLHASSGDRKTHPDRSSVAAGILLTLACAAYLTWSLLDLKR